MAEETLAVSSTTDGQEAVESAAQGTSDGVPVSESSLQNFTESKSGDGQTVVTSFENSQSERQALLERLAEAEQEIIELPAPVDEGTADESVIDMEAVRQAATADAIADARQMHRQVYYPEPAQPNSVEDQLHEIRVGLEQDFARRFEAVKPPDLGQLMAAAGQEGTDVSPEVADTLMTLDGGPQAVIYLLRHADERQKLARLPNHIAIGYAGHLAAQLATPPRRQRSNAPAPITPVSGSPTRSSLPLEDLSYQDYRAARERQIRAKRGR